MNKWVSSIKVIALFVSGYLVGITQNSPNSDDQSVKQTTYSLADKSQFADEKSAVFERARRHNLEEERSNRRQPVNLNQLIETDTHFSDVKAENSSRVTLQQYSEAVIERHVTEATKMTLEVSNDEMEQMQSVFEYEDNYSESALLYRERIADFLNSEVEGNHYLNDVDCKAQYCQLSINIKDKQLWKQTFTKLTNESWWSSVAFTRVDSDIEDHTTLMLVNHFDSEEQLIDFVAEVDDGNQW